MKQIIFHSIFIIYSSLSIVAQDASKAILNSKLVQPELTIKVKDGGSNSELKSLHGSIEFYSTFEEFQTDCFNLDLLTFEDFEGGPFEDFEGCGTEISSEGGKCFPTGEIQEGVIFTNSGADVGATMIYINSGDFFGIENPGVSSNNFFSSTYVVFTGEIPVTSIAFDLYSPIGSGVIDVRIFGVTTGLIETVSFEASNIAQFVGFSSAEPIERIELQNLDNELIETVSQFYFGSCDQEMSIDETILSGISIFPNPAQNEITIESESFVENVIIYSLDGQQVAEHLINSSSPSLDVSKLTPGVYFLEVHSDEQIGISKFVKE